MKRGLLSLILGICLPLLASAASDVREWKSQDGTESVSGRLHGQNTTTITLILENGRSRTVEKRFLCEEDLAFLASAGAGNGREAKAAYRSPVTDALKGKLEDENGKGTELDPDVKPDFFLFYYSASWCGPCRSFSPELVRFYNRQKAKKNLHVVLISSDKTEEDTVAYLKEFKMPWLVVKFNDKNNLSKEIPRNATGFIPAIILTDGSGKILLANSPELTKEELLKQTAKMLADSEG